MYFSYCRIMTVTLYPNTLLNCRPVVLCFRTTRMFSLLSVETAIIGANRSIRIVLRKLMSGSRLVINVEALSCYYVHGEDNRNFQRCSYWMLDQERLGAVFFVGQMGILFLFTDRDTN